MEYINITSMRNNKSKSFWVTNICNRNVSLADLNLTIKAFSSVNLLDNKHYNYTIEQLERSSLNGSLSKKSKIIAIRKVEPEVMRPNVPQLNETYIPSRDRSIFTIKEEKYEELNFSDEDFANQNAELAESDRTASKKV
jgi:hypothetical protein